MPRTATPQTAAERQRAFRARKRAQATSDPLPRDPGPPPDDPDDPAEPPIGDPPSDDDIDHVRFLAEALHKAVARCGGQSFIERYLRTSPSGGLRLYRDVAIALKRDATPVGIEIVVQQLVIGNATPTPGVLASPIQAHVAPQRVLLNQGEVVDAG
jgi:hypothetical protein